MKINSVLILFLFCFPQWGYSGDQPLGLREECRSLLAGIYLSFYDQKAQSETWLDFLAKDFSRLQKRQTELKETLAQTQGKENPLETLAERQELDRLTADLKAVDRAIEENESMKTQYKEQKKRDPEGLKKALESSIFSFLSQKETSSGYPWILAYQRPCPQFRQNCPLNPEEQKKLTNLGPALPEGKTPESCQKYLWQSKRAN